MLPLHAAEKNPQTTLTTFKKNKVQENVTWSQPDLFFALLSFCHLSLPIHFLPVLSVFNLSGCFFFYLLALSLPLFAASILIAHVFASAAPAYWSLTKTHKLVCTNILRYMDVPFPFPNSPKTILLCSPVLSHTLFIHVHVPALPCA